MQNTMLNVFFFLPQYLEANYPTTHLEQPSCAIYILSIWLSSSRSHFAEPVPVLLWCCDKFAPEYCYWHVRCDVPSWSMSSGKKNICPIPRSLGGPFFDLLFAWQSCHIILYWTKVLFLFLLAPWTYSAQAPFLFLMWILKLIRMQIPADPLSLSYNPLGTWDRHLWKT